MTVGGDGTFLRGARVAAVGGAAVLGVDVGRVGFLTTVELSALERALDAVHAGAAEFESRLTLTMRASRPLQIPEGLGVLLRYGRGPAPAPPAVHDSLPEQVGWVSRWTSSRSMTSSSRSSAGTARPAWACTSVAGCSPPTPPTR